MNYYKVSFTCESPVSFEEINDHLIDEIFDFIEEKINGEVGVASVWAWMLFPPLLIRLLLPLR